MPAFRYPPHAIETLPDAPGDRYRFRFKVASSSGNGEYTIAYDSAPNAGYWTCSCPCGIHRGHCKHLDAAGLLGRRYGRSPLPTPAPARAERQAVAVARTPKARARRAAPTIATPAARVRSEKTRVSAALDRFLASAPEELLASLGTI